MSSVLGRLAGFFYEPQASARALVATGDESAAAAKPAVAVLAGCADAIAAASAVALGLAHRRHAPAVLVCLWGDGPDPAGAWRASASPAARRLAATLTARGHDAHARGRLAVVRLGAAEDDAVAEARRACAAAGGVPIVLALGRPRGVAFDRVLAGHDLVVVATRADDGGVGRLAVSRLEAGAAVAAFQSPAALMPRVLAAGGFGLTRSLKRAVGQALGELL